MECVGLRLPWTSQLVIKIGKITKFAVPPTFKKIDGSQCNCEKLSHQALAWMIHTAGDYCDGRYIHRKLSFSCLAFILII